MKVMAVVLGFLVFLAVSTVGLIYLIQWSETISNNVLMITSIPGVTKIMAATLLVRVQTFNIKTDEFQEDRVVDMNRKDTQEWFFKHCVWAWLNGHGVQTMNERDYSDADGKTGATNSS
jgi:hypothetical protein